MHPLRRSLFDSPCLSLVVVGLDSAALFNAEGSVLPSCTFFVYGAGGA